MEGNANNQRRLRGLKIRLLLAIQAKLTFQITTLLLPCGVPTILFCLVLDMLVRILK